MRRIHKLAFTASVGAGAVAIAASFAIAGQESPSAAVRFAPGELPVVVPKHNNVGAPHQTSVAAFRAHIEAAGAAPESDWNTAKSFAIAGTDLNGWTFSGGGQECLAVPDPVVEGYGVKCGDAKEVAGGEVALVFAPAIQTGKPNIAAVLSSGPASLSGGEQGDWKRSGSVTAGKVADGAVIEVASRRITVTREKATKLVPAER